MKSTASFRAHKVVEACQEIAGFSDNPAYLVRTYLSPATRRVHDFLRSWMDRLGMRPSIDAVGNLRGLYPGKRQNAGRLLIGSHIDTVPNAGAFDGVLGVIMGLALIEGLEADRLDYDIEIVAFSEEEGVRFGVPFIGSRALIGDIDAPLLQLTDPRGVSVAQAMESFGLNLSELHAALLNPATFAFLEFHIEQGPVLDQLNAPLGIVEAIAGQSRYELTFHGKANHAGTTPMSLRHDALTGAAEWIGAVEQQARITNGLVATVGRLEVTPGATNVIPSEVRLSLDLRHTDDATRHAAADDMEANGRQIASTRGLQLSLQKKLDQPAIPLDRGLRDSLAAAVAATGRDGHRMNSGAGHDAMVLARKLPSAMLFLRSPAGISHHPDETVLVEDVQAALDAGLYFLKHLNPPPTVQKNL
ncbi:N-carbamoyl-L-amino acid hydrolase [Acidisarcina polymorpha]|uniref:N-carbamoyl-L-amino acid hydrolase n=1 Tax=Acidisarcina polymorpha TaxID=2211140 RepID=A0A2Z5FY30_9BACT|nr:allantoate amidohydrolase [Acidisarcina polymorpha]AXC11778.1 N-carbamoyl-L-amino acid hydrolase [Acidisarcina polymorpha]